MLILNCPYCGCDKDETELSAGGEAHLKRFGPGALTQSLRAICLAVRTQRGCILSAGVVPLVAENGFMLPAAPPRWKCLEPIRPRPLSCLKILRMPLAPNGPDGHGGGSHDPCLFTA